MPKRIYSTCTMKGCSQPHYGRGFCMMHWKRWRRWGDPLISKRGQRLSTPEERFWAKVKKTDGCWLWIAHCYRGGHGAFRPSRRIPMTSAHRFSWVLHFGPIPDHLMVLHDCGTHACVRPDHLYLGTQKQNMRDRDRHGRTQAGPTAVRAKLTMGQATEIRRRYATTEESMATLAAEYGVGCTTVRNVVRGFTY